MAAPQLSLSADRYSCSVCLDILKQPVTIPCGHNYCMKCITDCWDKADKDGVCPQCRQVFVSRPLIKRNEMLKDIIEKLEDVKGGVTPSQTQAGHHDVSCGICGDTKQRAVKTCLTCMISYCETHLQPHRQSEAYKNHKLEEPTGDIKEKLCAKHQEVLKIFCKTDQSCVCLLCVVTEHKSHDTVTPEEERAERQVRNGDIRELGSASSGSSFILNAGPCKCPALPKPGREMKDKPLLCESTTFI
uniref:E3 ubiquitin/ISG15 ligase TRIM25-like n=1 Tax=Erpetoichthys calabaricus TaxID=27687 RepID=A0A8C4SQB5_ERPCA